MLALWTVVVPNSQAQAHHHCPPFLTENENGTCTSWRGKEETRKERRKEGRTQEGRKEMSLVPVGKSTGRKRPLNENERAKQRREKEKADWHRRNPDSKWNGR